jgi:hypothetical protein
LPVIRKSIFPAGSESVALVGAVGERLIEAAVRGLRLPVGGEDDLVGRMGGCAAEERGERESVKKPGSHDRFRALRSSAFSAAIHASGAARGGRASS